LLALHSFPTRRSSDLHREHAAVDRGLHHGSRVVDIARREDDVGTLAEQADGTRLGRCRIVPLGITGLDLKAPSAHAALGVDLLRSEEHTSELQSLAYL